MHANVFNNTHILVLEKGEDIIPCLSAYCKENQIEAGWLSGLGALSEVDLALYETSTKKYHNLTLSEPLKILSLTGNIATQHGKIITHLHAALSNRNMEAFGGHLTRAIISATCEIRLEKFDSVIERKFDQDIGLNLISKS